MASILGENNWASCEGVNSRQDFVVFFSLYFNSRTVIRLPYLFTPVLTLRGCAAFQNFPRMMVLLRLRDAASCSLFPGLSRDFFTVAGPISPLVPVAGPLSRRTLLPRRATEPSEDQFTPKLRSLPVRHRFIGTKWEYKESAVFALSLFCLKHLCASYFPIYHFSSCCLVFLSYTLLYAKVPKSLLVQVQFVSRKVDFIDWNVKSVNK